MEKYFGNNHYGCAIIVYFKLKNYLIRSWRSGLRKLHFLRLNWLQKNLKCLRGKLMRFKLDVIHKFQMYIIYFELKDYLAHCQQKSGVIISGWYKNDYRKKQTTFLIDLSFFHTRYRDNFHQIFTNFDQFLPIFPYF